ncbi:hypothetical protein KMT30_41805 [Streptomyces sp. IBSBF 2953]|jgi:hypothetical protein|nr:hypothetical protein [Streptomyces hayashii]
MAGKLQITNFAARGCNVAISLPAELSGEVIIADATATGCGEGIVQRDPQSLAAKLGLPLDTPQEMIIEAARAINGRAGNAEEQKRTLQGLPIWAYLSRVKDVSSVMTALVGAAKTIAGMFPG